MAAPASGEQWLDREAGPIVRSYAVVGGRTRPAGGDIDLIAMVTALRRAAPDPATLEPEHVRVLRLCRRPAAVADLAAGLDLPIGVVRVLLADLRGRGLIAIHRPVPPSERPDLDLLRRVADGLRQL
jgi:Protein of unknown function (DUF742)